MNRLVRIKTTEATGIQSFNVDVSTYGDIIGNIPSINFEGKRVVVRENKVTLQSKDAKLPDGDITLYVMPEKTKAGGSFGDMNFHQLRSACSKRNIPSAGKTKEELITALEEYTSEDGAESAPSTKAGILSTISAVQEKLSDIYTKVESLSEEQATSYTLDELEEDFEAVAEELELA